ncbi:hypothetical protein PRUB_a3316 [Pseudoalteromonas rubra]|uniref:DUF4926 domain-containing protein n=1 Tax=Pseudoalteromonas rubra TaxID=43658 RepID=A0A8T0C2N4_9GAMM|nr:hypothetical protein [Pseudoalteromonas rubra]KAF7783526.1 hypothetical protein PRUB_a3316 [Pseudoalteromonas rubra]
MKQYSVVKIISLNKVFIHSEKSIGSRAPKVGDVGTIVDIYGEAIDIECSDENGMTVWLELFEPGDADLKLLHI